MDCVQIIKNEFELRVFQENYSRIYTCLNLLNDEEIWKSYNKNSPSIANLILHLCGNARQWIISGIDGAPDIRNREEEFLPQKNIRKSDLIFLLEHLKGNIHQSLENLTKEKLEKTYIIQTIKSSGFSVLCHVIEHFSYHTGQISTLTKLQKNQDLGYYKDFDLN